MNWTTPDDLRAQVSRLWERGIVLQSVLSIEPVFPKRLLLKIPSSQDFAHAFAEVRTWCDTLSQIQHVRFVHREVNHRVTGTNAYPVEAWLDSAESAVELLGKTRQWRQFNRIVETTRARCPELLDWMAKRPMTVLDVSEEWERLLDLVQWLASHPRPGCYLRQVDLRGIDTKFIEGHRGILGELLDIYLPAAYIDTAHVGLGGFCKRYGFREKPERIRFRILDSRYDPLNMGCNADISLNLEAFAALERIPKNLFITENETNFLAFPKLANSWIIFGAGYGFSNLHQINWMNTCRIVYWGDIDTHGFAILDELLSHFPSAESMLMNRATLISHSLSWGTEPSQCKHALTRLTPEENALYRELQSNQIANNLRLEQERISFSMLLDILSTRGFTLL